MSSVVKYFAYNQGGAPSVTNVWGDLITLLDACLVGGFNFKTIDTITATAGYCTAIISGGHTYTVNQVVEITGANEDYYTGEFRVTEVTSTSFKFVALTPSAPAATTSTAITCKVAPLGFEKVFSNSTTKAVYRTQNPMSYRPYLRVDNSQDANWTPTYAKAGKVTMAENMVDIDTFGAGGRAPYDGSNPYKNETVSGSGTTAINGWYKWFTQKASGGEATVDGSAATPKLWALVGDDRGFYLHIAPTSGTAAYACYAFTDFSSTKANDAYNSILCANDWYYAANSGTPTTIDGGNTFDRNWDYNGKVLMKDFTGLGDSVRVAFYTLGFSNAQIYSGNTPVVPYPNAPDLSMQLWPVYLRTEAGSYHQGQMPGMYFIPHSIYNSVPAFTVIDTVTGFLGRKFVVLPGGYTTGQSRIAYDITGPWDRGVEQLVPKKLTVNFLSRPSTFSMNEMLLTPIDPELMYWNINSNSNATSLIGTPYHSVFEIGDITHGLGRSMFGGIGHATGKRYFEVLMVSVFGAGAVSDGDAVGVAYANSPTVGQWGLGGAFYSNASGTPGIAYAHQGSVYNYLYQNGAIVANSGVFDTQVIGVAYNADAHTVTFYRDGVFMGTVSNVTGMLYPAAHINTYNTQWKLRVLSSEFTKAIPAGHTAWAY